MKLSLDDLSAGLLITAYTDTSVTINNHVIEQGMVVSPERLISDWSAKSLNELSSEHIEEILALRPEIVILGTGSRQRFPEEWVYTMLSEQQVGLEVMDSGAACRTYNILVAEGRRVAAALFFDPVDGSA